MKKLFVIACMMLASTAMFAQQGTTSVGVNALYGLHSDYKNFGIGAKVQYEFIESFRGEASFNYFLKKDGLTMWDANLNLHYLIPIADNLKIYPLAGLTLLGSKIDASNVMGGNFSGTLEQFVMQYSGITAAELALIKTAAPAQYAMLEAQYNATKNMIDDNSSNTDLGANLGAGIELNLTEKFKVNFEAKYQIIKDWNRPVIAVGVAYNL